MWQIDREKVKWWRVWVAKSKWQQSGYTVQVKKSETSTRLIWHFEIANANYVPNNATTSLHKHIHLYNNLCVIIGSAISQQSFQFENIFEFECEQQLVCALANEENASVDTVKCFGYFVLQNGWRINEICLRYISLFHLINKWAGIAFGVECACMWLVCTCSNSVDMMFIDTAVSQYDCISTVWIVWMPSNLKHRLSWMYEIPSIVSTLSKPAKTAINFIHTYVMWCMFALPTFTIA